MKISVQQVKKAIEMAQEASKTREVDEAVIRLTDKETIDRIVREVQEMPDREEMIADLKKRIEAGTYSPSGDEIADAMIRRAIADCIQ